jgi:Tfp pilus assembly PilM family ATPase
VSVVRFESIPARTADLDELVRWQIKKTTPFPLDDAVIAYSPGQKVDGGGEFVVTVARRDVLAQYEQVCAMAGAHAGVVDLATFNVVNVVLASGRAPSGDWLLVHAADAYVSLAVLRDGQMIFYRTRGDDTEDGSVADLVHQTAMYYEDRLGGTRFCGVLLAGGATVEGAEFVPRALTGRLGLDVVAVEPFRAARAADRQRVTDEDADLVAAGVGMLCRFGAQA